MKLRNEENESIATPTAFNHLHSQIVTAMTVGSLVMAACMLGLLAYIYCSMPGGAL